MISVRRRHFMSNSGFQSWCCSCMYDLPVLFRYMNSNFVSFWIRNRSSFDKCSVNYYGSKILFIFASFYHTLNHNFSDQSKSANFSDRKLMLALLFEPCEIFPHIFMVFLSAHFKFLRISQNWAARTNRRCSTK